MAHGMWLLLARRPDGRVARLARGGQEAARRRRRARLVALRAAHVAQQHQAVQLSNESTSGCSKLLSLCYSREALAIAARRAATRSIISPGRCGARRSVSCGSICSRRSAAALRSGAVVTASSGAAAVRAAAGDGVGARRRVAADRVSSIEAPAELPARRGRAPCKDGRSSLTLRGAGLRSGYL